MPEAWVETVLSCARCGSSLEFEDCEFCRLVSADMRPPDAVRDPTDLAWVDAILGSERDVCFASLAPLPDLSYFRARQFRTARRFTTRRPPTSRHVRHVLCMSTPRQMVWIPACRGVAGVSSYGRTLTRPTIEPQDHMADPLIIEGLVAQLPAPALFEPSDSVQPAPFTRSSPHAFCDVDLRRGIASSGLNARTARPTLRHLGPPVRFGQGRGDDNRARPTHFRGQSYGRRGSGRVPFCASSGSFCEENPLPGREAVERHTVEETEVQRVIG